MYPLRDHTVAGVIGHGAATPQVYGDRRAGRSTLAVVGDQDRIRVLQPGQLHQDRTQGPGQVVRVDARPDELAEGFRFRFQVGDLAVPILCGGGGDTTGELGEECVHPAALFGDLLGPFDVGLGEDRDFVPQDLDRDLEHGGQLPEGVGVGFRPLRRQ